MVGLLISAMAWGGTFEVTLDAARQAMVDGDPELAAGLIRAAELHAPEAGTIMDSAELARIWMYRGMIVYGQGNPDDLATQLWRQAFAIDNEIEWDAAFYDDNDALGLFEGLRAESTGRPRAGILHPGAVGAAKLYVDGDRAAEEDTVRIGVHLAQVECPEEQGTFGVWTDFDKKFKWLKLCPAGVDTSVVVEEEPEDDEFGDFAPAFGVAAAGAGDDGPYEPLPPAALAPAPKKVSMPLLVSAGGAALISGGMYLAALNSRSQFDDVYNASLHSAGDVADLKQKTNTRVVVSAGTGAVALGLYTAAFIRF